VPGRAIPAHFGSIPDGGSCDNRRGVGAPHSYRSMRSNLTTVAESTVPEKILLAALDLEEQGQSPFSAEALIVAAWQKYPKTFGLKGYADLYPDSNKVLSSIMGVRGLAGRGWLAKMGQKLYVLSREGRQYARRLEHGDVPAPAEETVKVSREQEKFLNALWAAAAFGKFLEGRKAEITFADACAFWGVTDAMRGPAVNAALDHVRAELAALERLLTLGDTALSNGRSVSLDDVNRLHDINGYLEERFARHLNLLRSRAGRG
jgi:hypothetical protein